MKEIMISYAMERENRRGEGKEGKGDILQLRTIKMMIVTANMY